MQCIHVCHQICPISSLLLTFSKHGLILSAMLMSIPLTSSSATSSSIRVSPLMASSVMSSSMSSLSSIPAIIADSTVVENFWTCAAKPVSAFNATGQCIIRVVVELTKYVCNMHWVKCISQMYSWLFYHYIAQIFGLRS